MIKTVFFALMLFGTITSGAQTLPVDVIDLIVHKEIIARDSGQQVSRGFLQSCIKQVDIARYIIECDDVLFVHHISLFERSDIKSTIVLITEDGASVENRWIFENKKGKYVDVKEDLWPEITDQMVSDQLVRVTGDKRYTAEYVNRVAHSPYRTQHSSANTLIIRSGIPDKSNGVKLGEVEWTGTRFIFKSSMPKNE